MNLKLRNIGNSVGVILPLHLIKQHNLHAGDTLIAKDSQNSIELIYPKISDKKYNLKDLVAQTDNFRDEGWLDMVDTGLEVINE